MKLRDLDMLGLMVAANQTMFANPHRGMPTADDIANCMDKILRGSRVTTSQNRRHRSEYPADLQHLGDVMKLWDPQGYLMLGPPGWIAHHCDLCGQTGWHPDDCDPA